MNVGSLETLARKDRGDAVAYTTIDMGDGVEGDFCIENFSEETAGRLIAACKQVQNRAMTDDVITNAIAEALPDYLSGASSLEATPEDRCRYQYLPGRVGMTVHSYIHVNRF